MTNSKNTNNTTQTTPESKLEEPKKVKKAKERLILPSLSVVTAVSVLIGYGYEREVAEIFGLNVSEIADSPVDFMLGAGEALPFLLNKLIENFSFLAIWKSAIWQSVIWGVVFFVAFVVYDIFLRKDNQRKVAAKSAEASKNKIKDFIVNNRYSQYILVILVSVGAIPVSIFCVYVFIVVVMIVPIFIVFFGIASGAGIAQDYIINPTHCAPYARSIPITGKKKEPSQKEIFATCVAVIKDGDEVVRGRRIASHAEHIFLYIKKTGEVKAVPLNDATVVLVDSEEPPIKNDVNVKPQDSAQPKPEKQGGIAK